MENISGLGLFHVGIKDWETASILYLGIIFSTILRRDRGTGQFLTSSFLGSCPTEDEEKNPRVCSHLLFPEEHKEI